MPTYTVIDKTTGKETTHVCKYSELEEMLQSNPNLQQKLTTPGFVPSSMSTLRRAGSGWNDLLGRIKKNSGRGNTVNN